MILTSEEAEIPMEVGIDDLGDVRVSRLDLTGLADEYIVEGEIEGWLPRIALQRESAGISP